MVAVVAVVLVVRRIRVRSCMTSYASYNSHLLSRGSEVSSVQTSLGFDSMQDSVRIIRRHLPRVVRGETRGVALFDGVAQKEQCYVVCRKEI